VAIAAAIAVIAVGAGVVGGLVGRRLDPDPVPPQRASNVSLDVAPARDGELPPIDVAAVAEFVAPSVVTISADIEGPLGNGGSIGTGVFTTGDGEILTNAHVVEGASEIRIRLAGETEPRAATLLAADPGNDLALLRVAGDDYVPATFADPDSTQIGDEVVAIGFALDLDGDPSVTLGIVSALERTIITPLGALDGLLQTDAAISSGNSGGPLVNAAGEVVGINTAVARSDGSTAASNIGFAISVAEALPIIDALRDQASGTVREEGYLGVGLDDRRDGGQGAIITEVQEGTPAATGGILAGDIVIAVDDTTVDGGAGLVAAIRDRQPGDEVTVVLLREGERVTLTVTLTDRPEG
jgi:putative serine protease PepD